MFSPVSYANSEWTSEKRHCLISLVDMYCQINASYFIVFTCDIRLGSYEVRFWAKYWDCHFAAQSAEAVEYTAYNTVEE